VREMMTRVATSTTDTHCPADPIFAFADRTTVELKDGRQLDTGEIRFARGNARLPLSDGQLKAKFFDCVAGAEGFDAQALYERLYVMEKIDSIRDLPCRN